MNEHQLRNLADRLRTTSSSQAADEAAYLLELFAPLAPALKPLLAGLVRQRVEQARTPSRREDSLQRQLDDATRMAGELAKAMTALLAEPTDAHLAQAQRTLEHHRDWLVAHV